MGWVGASVMPAFPATQDGYERLIAWLAGFGEISMVGVESTGSYGAGLARALIGADIAVIEVNRPHRHTRRQRGKSDPIDAEAAARKVLAGEARVVPKDNRGVVEAIRLLRVARAGAVKARTAALNQLGELLVTAPEPLRRQISSSRKTLAGQAAICARLRPDVARSIDPEQAAKLALRSVAGRVVALDDQVRELDEHLAGLVGRTAPHTIALLGVGVGHAGQAAGHGRTEHRATQLGWRFRPPVRDRPDPCILGQDRAPSAQSGR